MKRWRVRETIVSVFLVTAVFTAAARGASEAPSMKTGEELAYRLLPRESEVSFKAGSTLHDFSGSTRAMVGMVRGVPRDLPHNAWAQVRIRAAELRTESNGINRNMWHDLDVKRFPEIVFTLKRVEGARESADASSAEVTISGVLSLHGVERDIRMKAVLGFKGKKVVFDGSKVIKMSDFTIVPTRFLFLRVYDEVTVTIHLVGARVPA